MAVVLLRWAPGLPLDMGFDAFWGCRCSRRVGPFEDTPRAATAQAREDFPLSWDGKGPATQARRQEALRLPEREPPAVSPAPEAKRERAAAASPAKSPRSKRKSRRR